MSYYDVLGVKPSASKDEIKSAYPRLVKKYHPDMPGGNAKKFMEVQKAYEAVMGGNGSQNQQQKEDPFKRAYEEAQRANQQARSQYRKRHAGFDWGFGGDPFEGFAGFDEDPFKTDFNWQQWWDSDIGGKKRTTYSTAEEKVSTRLVRQLLQYDVENRKGVYMDFSWKCDGCHNTQNGGTMVYYFAAGEKKLCGKCKKDIVDWLKDDTVFRG